MTTVSLGCIFVGLVWGATNPLIKRGTSHLSPSATRSQATALRIWWRTLVDIVLCPSFQVPQAANALAGALFAWLLGWPGASLSIAVPLANGTSLGVNAVADLLLGDRHDLRFTVPGLALVTLGLALCLAA